MITIDSVSKRFGRATAVDGVTLAVGAGDSVALWGSNGAGKTTLIRCVLGLLRFRGRIVVGGHDVRRRGKRARRLIGYVPQELGFYDDLGVAEAIGFFGRLKGVAVPSSDEVLATVGLAGHGGKRVRELSGGMKQRLALAIALLGDPPVLVLDEVTASLDACGRNEFITLLSRLSIGEGGVDGAGGRTLLFASHRLDEVASLSKRVVVLERGKMVSVEPAAAFAARHGDRAVLHLVIPNAARAQAMGQLRAGGFAPMLNGVGVLVPVQPEHKAAPFRVLAEARIPVDDFEMVSAQEAQLHRHSAEAQPGTEVAP